MTRVEKYVNKIRHLLANKDVLEVACGTADFTIKSSEYTHRAYCIDLENHRINPDLYEKSNASFQIMDASNMTFADDSFDVVIIYNALGHLKHVLEKVMQECLRVKKADGLVIIIASWGLDKMAIEENLIPHLENNYITFTRDDEKDAVFLYV